MKTHNQKVNFSNELYKEIIGEMLTIIEKSLRSKEELTLLYEIKEKIKKFELVGNTKINQIISLLSEKRNLMVLFRCKEENIVINEMDFNNNEIYVCSNISLDVIDNDKVRNLICALNDIVSTKENVDLSNLKIIGYTANLEELKDASKLNNLTIIGQRAYFNSLESSLGLSNLKIIGGNAHFTSLKDATCLYNLKIIGGNAYFNSLIDSTGLYNLKIIGGYAQFTSLKSATGLNGLESIANLADFSNLKSASGLSNLKYIGGTAFFDSLESLNGLNKELVIDGDVYFGNKITVEDIINSGITINGDVYIDETLVPKEGFMIETSSENHSVLVKTNKLQN